MFKWVTLCLGLMITPALATNTCNLVMPATATSGQSFTVVADFPIASTASIVRNSDMVTVQSNLSGGKQPTLIFATEFLGPHTYTMTVTNPNGVQYSCSSTTTFTYTLDPTITGYDIIIIAGQSNTDGGEGPFTSPKQSDFTNVLQVGRFGLSDGQLVPFGYKSFENNGEYYDGLQFWLRSLDLDNRLGFSSEFIDDYVTHGYLASNRQLVIVPVAHGTTSITQWIGINPQPGDVLAKGTTLYLDMITRADTALALPNSKIVAFLWDQSETDILNAITNVPGAISASDFQTYTSQFFSNVRRDLGVTFPILTGLPATSWQAGNSIKSAFISSLVASDSADVCARPVYTNGLTTNGPLDPHINAASSITFGDNYFTQFMASSC